MQNGLYKVAFQTPIGAGAGVVVLQDGNLSGGDSSMYYVGSYAVVAGQFTAEVLANRHTPGQASVFGKDKTRISLTGTAQEASAQATGTSPDAPSVRLQATLTRIIH